MKKCIALLLVLLMALAMAACGGQGAVTGPEPEEVSEEEPVVDATPVQEETPAEEESPPEESAEVPEEESAASGEVKITVNPPEGWEAIDSTGMLYAYQKVTATFMIQTESLNIDADTLDMVLPQAKEIISSMFDNVEYEGDIESITVGNYDASKMMFTCDVSELTMKFEYVFFIVGGDVYAITFGDLAATFDDNAGDFQVILDSIVID